jgi:hypothetical protein
MADARVSGVAAWLAAARGAGRWLGLSLLGMSACAAPQAAPASPAPPPREEHAPASGFAAGARVIEAKGQGLEFPLPDASGWRWDQHEKHSWVARLEDCEREARSFRRELPVFTPAEIISESDRLLAGTYRGRVTVGVRPGPASAPERVLGDVLGFGSDARACLMLAFSTSAAGPGARQIIAERLATIAGTVFERARRLEIEGRVSVPHL